MKKITLVMLLIALVVCLAGCSQKKIDELTTAFNAEKESLQAAAQEKLDAVTAEKDGLIAKAQEELENAKAAAEANLKTVTEQKDALIAIWMQLT